MKIMKNGKKSKEAIGQKRTWLPNVDYKHGGLKKPNEPKIRQKRKKVDENDDGGDDFDVSESKPNKRFNNKRKASIKSKN
jgi:hypothetical protein